MEFERDVILPYIRWAFKKDQTVSDEDLRAKMMDYSKQDEVTCEYPVHSATKNKKRQPKRKRSDRTEEGKLDDGDDTRESDGDDVRESGDEENEQRGLQRRRLNEHPDRDEGEALSDFSHDDKEGIKAGMRGFKLGYDGKTFKQSLAEHERELKEALEDYEDEQAGADSSGGPPQSPRSATGP